MSKKTKLIFTFAAFILIIAGGYFAVNPRTVFSRETIKNSPVLLALRNVKLSLIKFPDIIHLPYWLQKTELEQYSLEISRNDMSRLDAGLPRDIYDGKLMEENKIDVPVYFKAPGYEAKVKVRYRGFGSNHWNAHQRSYLVKFPKNNLYKGMDSMAFIIAYDRGYYAEILAGYRAEKFGLKTPKMEFVRMKLNGQDNGVYLGVEQWSKNWLAHEGLAENDSIFTTIKTADESLYYEQTLLRAVGQKYWKDYADNTDQEPLKNLAILTEKADNASFAKYIPDILDMDAFYGWAKINILAGSFHQSDGTMVLLYNRVTGKFEPIPWDVNHYWLNDAYFQDADTLTKRILSIPEFYERFRREVLSYVNDPINMEDELKFYDDLADKMKPEFYSDRVKFHNDRTFISLTKRTRKQIADNFQKIPAMLGETPPIAYQAPQNWKSSFTGSFSYLVQANMTPSEFVSKNPQFRLQNGEIAIGPGNYFLSGTVIVPEGTSLSIASGTNIFMAGGSSLVSYSPITARGTASQPIAFRRATGTEPWGVLAIANTEDESFLSNVILDGGSSSVQINGVTFTGMLSVHNSRIRIVSSKFLNDYEDDAVNIKYSNGAISQSHFLNNNGDALDLDESSSFSIFSNLFDNNGYGYVPGHTTIGDAIDVSFNESTIEGNVITNCGDKGISIGENSKPKLLNNIIINCEYGIAVKDNSSAYLAGNTLLNNKKGLGLYLKKPEFAGGGKVTAERLTMWGNDMEIEKDGNSDYFIKHSTIEGGAEGENISTNKPDFRRILPAFLLDNVKNLID